MRKSLTSFLAWLFLAPAALAQATYPPMVTTGTIVNNSVPLFVGTTGRTLQSGPVITTLAPLASPAFTGTPTAPTATLGTNTTQLATTAFVIANAGGSAVASFNTRTGAVVLLLSDVTGVGGAPIASPTFTGTPTAPTAAPGTNTTQLATTGFVAASFAPLASPTFTGTPAAPTATVGTNTTQLATTAFVLANASGSPFPTAFSTKSANYTVVNGDKNTFFTLSGSFTLSLPSAASFGANNGIFVRKVDGSGVWAITPASGTIDGLSSINTYQERFSLVSDGTNWFSVDREKGWINLSTQVIGSSVATVVFTTGFGDSELRDMRIAANGSTAAGVTNLGMQVSKNGSLQTGSTYNVGNISGTANAVSALNATGQIRITLTSNSSSTNLDFDVEMYNIGSATAIQQQIKFSSYSDGSQSYYSGRTYETSNFAIQGVTITGLSANITGGVYTQQAFRP